MKPRRHRAAVAFLLTALPAAAADHVSVVGDSLTKEYEITFPGVPLAGVAGIDDTNPSARNWAEILHARRNAHFDAGIFKASLFSPWSDLRLLGHEYNWAVPGASSRAVSNLLLGENTSELTSDPDFSQLTAFAPEWEKGPQFFTAQVQAATSIGVVIWCGGNDLRFGNSDPATTVGGTKITYSTIYSGNGTGSGDPLPLMNSMKASIQKIAQRVKTIKPGVPIAVCAVPHIGCAPVVKSTSPTDPVRTGRITASLDALNAELKTWTESTLGGAWVDTYTLTKSLISQPLDIGGVSFPAISDTATAADPAPVHNRFVFSHDGFHPGTAAQAKVAQLVHNALRAKYPAVFGSSAPLTDRELLVNVLSLSASLGFDDFMVTSGVAGGLRGADQDADNDGLKNIAEFALAGNNPASGAAPALPVAAIDRSGDTPMLTLTWMPRFASNVYCTITCQQSDALGAWTDVSAGQITDNQDGSHTAVIPVTGAARYLRLKITVTP